MSKQMIIIWVMAAFMPRLMTQMVKETFFCSQLQSSNQYSSFKKARA